MAATGWAATPRSSRTARYRDSLWNTLILGVAVTVTSMVVGGALAILVARCSFRFAGWVAALPLVTLVIPDVVVAAAWTLILGQQGIVNTLARSPPGGRSARSTRGGASSS